MLDAEHGADDVELEHPAELGQVLTMVRPQPATTSGIGDDAVEPAGRRRAEAITDRTSSSIVTSATS